MELLEPQSLAWMDPQDVGPLTARPALLVDTAVGPVDPDLVERFPCPVLGVGPFDPACDTRLTADEVVRVMRNVANAPFTASVLVQLMRMTRPLPPAAALTAESLAYAAVQHGQEFRRWQRSRPDGSTSLSGNAAPLLVERTGSHLRLVLNDPDRRNEIGTTMRDALCEALDVAVLDQQIEQVSLEASGRVFSTGGAVGEFGTVSDPATAHAIRTVRLPASRLLRLHQRLHVHVDGAAIGAGLEMAAFAKHLTASKRAWFQLPELAYGLIPGAGGTVSVAGRIGRHRTVWMALSMARVRARQALAWGLVDELR